MRIISVGNGIIWKYRRITDKVTVRRVESNQFLVFLWYIEENRCIMQGRDREKRGRAGKMKKKIPGAKERTRKDGHDENRKSN